MSHRYSERWGTVQSVIVIRKLAGHDQVIDIAGSTLFLEFPTLGCNVFPHCPVVRAHVVAITSHLGVPKDCIRIVHVQGLTIRDSALPLPKTVKTALMLFSKARCKLVPDAFAASRNTASFRAILGKTAMIGGT